MKYEKAFNLPLYVHEKEVSWLADPMKNGSGKYAELPNYIVKVPDEEHIIRKEHTLRLVDLNLKAYLHQDIHQEVFHIFLKMMGLQL